MRKNLLIYALSITMLSACCAGCGDRSSSQETKTESSSDQKSATTEETNLSEEGSESSEESVDSEDDPDSFMESDNTDFKKINFAKRTSDDFTESSGLFEEDTEEENDVNWGNTISGHVVDLLPCSDTFVHNFGDNIHADYAILLDNGDVYACYSSSAQLLFKGTDLTSFDGVNFMYTLSSTEANFGSIHGVYYFLVTQDRIIAPDYYEQGIPEDLYTNPTGQYKEFKVENSVFLSNDALSSYGTQSVGDDSSSACDYWIVYAVENGDLVAYMVNVHDFSQQKLNLSFNVNVKIKKIIQSQLQDHAFLCVGEDNKLYTALCEVLNREQKYTQGVNVTFTEVTDNVEDVLGGYKADSELMLKGKNNSIYYYENDWLEKKIKTTDLIQIPADVQYWVIYGYSNALNFFTLDTDLQMKYYHYDLSLSNDPDIEDITLAEKQDDVKKIIDSLNMDKIAPGSECLCVLGKDRSVYKIGNPFL